MIRIKRTALLLGYSVLPSIFLRVLTFQEGIYMRVIVVLLGLLTLVGANTV